MSEKVINSIITETAKYYKFCKGAVGIRDIIKMEVYARGLKVDQKAVSMLYAKVIDMNLF